MRSRKSTPSLKEHAMASRELASSSPASVAKLSSEDMLFVEVTRSNYEVPADKQLLRAVERYWLFRQSKRYAFATRRVSVLSRAFRSSPDSHQFNCTYVTRIMYVLKTYVNALHWPHCIARRSPRFRSAPTSNRSKSTRWRIPGQIKSR